MTLEQALQAIRPPDRAAMEAAQRRLDRLIKPLDSLGLLERSLVRIAGMTGDPDPDLSRKCVAVFCADNGVVAQGVSQSGSEVTAVVAENMTTGQTSVCNMARVAGARVVPVDVGVARPLDLPGLWNHRVMPGTKDFTKEPAMSRPQAVQAVEAGVAVAERLAAQGERMLATGEMGIGNTTTSSAVAAVLLDAPVQAVTGRGAGLPREGLDRKLDAIRRGIALHRPDRADPLDVLHKLGGLDIAAMAGLCLGGAALRLPVVLDGFISCVAALVAVRLQPLAGHYLLASHVSGEPAGPMLLEALGLEAPLHAGMRLGEGTGAVASFPLYDMMLAVYRNMVVFEDENMEAYAHYE